MELKFGHTHYVPVLRWKPAEADALSKLSDVTWDHLTPLLELCPPELAPKKENKRKKSPSQKIEDTISSMVENLMNAIGTHPVFIDLIHLPESIVCSNGEHIWNAILKKGKAVGMKVIPVTGFYGKGENNQAKISEVIQAFGNGAAIRLFRENLEKQKHLDAIPKLLEMLKTEIAQLDLLVDLQLIENEIQSFNSVVKNIPQIDDWRTVTIIAGSFPLDLRHLKANDTYIIQRPEFKIWQNDFNPLKGSASRRAPSFGDYTTQHAIYKEPVEHPHVSASLRYAAPEYWIVLRGEWIGKKGGSGCAQYPAEAQLLMERAEYVGKGFSFGDKFIAEKARNGAAHPGNSHQWRIASINHHITLAANTIQLEPFSASETEVVVPILSRQ